jgi:hypothetical protein
MSVTFIESMLLEALESVTTRRLAQVVMQDVARMRRDAPYPEDHASLLAIVRAELADACYLRLGAAGARAVTALEDRLHALAVLPRDLWAESSDRLVFVGRSPERGASMAAALHITDFVWVSELFQLLMAVDGEVRTCVLVDASDCSLPHSVLATFAPDFPRNVSVVVASMDVSIREEFLRTGAAFRTTMRPEPASDPAIAQYALAALKGGALPAKRRKPGGSTTTTEPARAA